MGQIVSVCSYYDPRPMLGVASVSAHGSLANTSGVANPSIERTPSGKLRLPEGAAHVKR